MRHDTALIVVDMQNAFCSTRGSYWRRGGSIAGLRDTIRVVRALIRVARSRGWLVVFTQLEFRSGFSDAGLLAEKFPEIRRHGAYSAGSWDSRISPALKRQRGDVVVKKTRYDPFIGTRFTGVLERNGVERLVVAGVLTNVCVESTVRAAFDRGYPSVVVRDATATYSRPSHAGALRTMRRHFADVVSLRDIRREFGE
jgi:ureidoacrylate peracid hydrolase